MKSQLGNDWRSKLAEFDDKPFAAASIGQVHKGVLHDGRQVAIKIQVYPLNHLQQKNCCTMCKFETFV